MCLDFGLFLALFIGTMKPFLNIPTPNNTPTANTTSKPTNNKRAEKDFVTEMIYLPRKKRRSITIACIFFIYFLLAPRFFGFLDIIKTTEDDSLSKYRSTIMSLAQEYSVPEALIAAVIKVESDFRPQIISPRGARGLMQIMPATGRSLDVSDLLNPTENIRAGAKYISILLDMFRGNLVLAVAAYNAGPGAVKRIGAIPPYPETIRYVQRVLHHYEIFKRDFGA